MKKKHHLQPSQQHQNAQGKSVATDQNGHEMKPASPPMVEGKPAFTEQVKTKAHPIMALARNQVLDQPPHSGNAVYLYAHKFFPLRDH